MYKKKDPSFAPAMCLGASLLLTLANPSVAQTNNESLGSNAGSSITTGDNNVMLGDNAGASLSSGSANTLVGESAGAAQTTASDSTFVGSQAGAAVTTGPDNVLVGARAGLSVTTGSDNTFVGTEAGAETTTGFDNTFIGERAGENNVEGSDNVFIGEIAGFSNVGGRRNTAVGSAALRSNRNGLFNTAVGFEAGFDIGVDTREDIEGIAVRNTAIGSNAGIDIGAGVANTMIGDNAGANTEWGDFNTFLGFQAGSSNNFFNSQTAANRNTSVGAYSGYSNVSGDDNVWVGALADTGRWTFDNDVEVDYLRGRTTAWNPAFAGAGPVSSGSASRTTVVGNRAVAMEDEGLALGYMSLTDGGGAVALGATAEAGHLNSVAIGYGAQTRAANTVVIGNNSMTSIQPGRGSFTSLGTPAVRFGGVFSTYFRAHANAGVDARVEFFADAGLQNADLWQLTAINDGNFTLDSYATGSWGSVLSVSNTGDLWITGDLTVESDARRKTGIARVEQALALVSQVDGYRYRWREELGRGDDERIGFLAQEVQAVMPELVSEQADGTLTVNYQGFVPVLTSAVRELRGAHQQILAGQQAEIDALNAERAQQRAEIESLRAELSTQKRLIAQLLALSESSNNQ